MIGFPRGERRRRRRDKRGNIAGVRSLPERSLDRPQRSLLTLCITHPSLQIQLLEGVLRYLN